MVVYLAATKNKIIYLEGICVCMPTQRFIFGELIRFISPTTARGNNNTSTTTDGVRRLPSISRNIAFRVQRFYSHKNNTASIATLYIGWYRYLLFSRDDRFTTGNVQVHHAP